MAVADEYIELPIDDEGHCALVRVADIHAIADTIDPMLCSIYTGHGNLVVPMPRDQVVARIDAWYEAAIRKVN